MTDLNISYEDGLRLSELNGTLEGLKYQAAHIFETHVTEFAGVVVVSALVSFLVMWYISMCFPEKPSKVRFDHEEDLKSWATRLYTYTVLTPARQEKKTDRRFNPNINGFERYTYTEDVPMEVRWRLRPGIVLLLFVIPVLIIAAVVGILDIHITAGIEMQMADVQAQIDTILAKYGGA